MQSSLNEANTSEKKWCLTKFEKKHGTLIWNICGFSLCSLGNSKCLKSSKFRISGEFEDWYLELYPNGKEEESLGFISVCLVLLFHDVDDFSDDESLSNPNLGDIKLTTCSISIVNASGKKAHAIEFSYEDQKGEDRYIARKDLLGSKDLLPNDQLTVSCVLTVTKRTISEGTSDSMCSKMLHVNSRFVQHNLSSDLARLLISQNNADVLLKVDGHEFRVHKALLVARSSPFSSMFDHQMVESATNTVTISDVEGDVMKELLSFVYTDSCSYTSVDFALKILAAADKYIIPSLKLHSADYLNSNVSADSVFQMLVAADAHGVASLRQKCIDFVCRELSYLMTVVPNWKSQFNSCPNVLCEILEQLAVSPDFDTVEDDM